VVGLILSAIFLYCIFKKCVNEDNQNNQNTIQLGAIQTDSRPVSQQNNKPNQSAKLSKLEIPIQTEERKSLKSKCALCKSLIIFGKSPCNCYICYRHCSEIRRNIIENIQVKFKCSIHNFEITDVLDLDEDWNNNYPGLDDIILEDINKNAPVVKVQIEDSNPGICKLCFVGQEEVNFKCGCKGLVCSSCYNSHVNVCKHSKCPFCRRSINSINI